MNQKNDKIILYLLLLVFLVIGFSVFKSSLFYQKENSKDKIIHSIPSSTNNTEISKKIDSSPDILSQKNDLATSTTTSDFSDSDKSSKSLSSPIATIINSDISLLKSLEKDIFGNDEEHKSNALASLSNLIEQGKGKEIVMKMWKSDNEELFNDAISLIPGFTESDRMDFIMQGLDNPNNAIKIESINLLRDIVNSDVNTALIKSLSNDSEEVLDEAASLFTYFGDKPIYEAAAEALNNPNENVRESAVSYLEDKFTGRAVIQLIEGLKNNYPDVVTKCGDALRFVTDAKITNNNYEDWLTWWQTNGSKWIEERGKDVE